ncbi:uncharacterized protein BXZ73DRAFT_44209 [Epithele typhae]|uniref:uncharacterized protein n=1 Tax=Epithele typhae TaxID=378194 RepID=UPI002008120D|nr:uncharacterized protein BXZ73DRAFT_44209 [Epithele typhae]KAH9938989.1 hypothetical protein BXZ73DRAFT_44209 [Epithele typhae]
MNFSTADINSFWDISPQQPDSFSALPDDDFLAFLQKQFPGAVGANQPPLSFESPAVAPGDGINPQSINSFAPPNHSPSSSDSSPSPPSTHHDSTVSRRQSGAFNDRTPESDSPTQSPSSLDDVSHKRKADHDDDGPASKSAHTSCTGVLMRVDALIASGDRSKKTVSSASARRKPGAPQDESRLLKRKEQNRAAQRAFRERKEKHVRDLEDKVAALEAKNQLSEQENENLRDLLTRLQSENMMLKQAAFTFTASRASNGRPSEMTNNAQNSFNQPMQFNFSSPGAGPSKSPIPTQSPPSHYDLNFSSLISFDPNAFAADELNDSMDMDPPPFSSQNPNQYKTIASNPMFMSFAEPSPADAPQMMLGGQPNQPHFQPMSFESFSDAWSPPADGNNQDALDQLFGGSYLASHGGVDFQALLASTPSALSPISHRTPSLTSSGSSPATGSGSAASPHTLANSPAGHGEHKDCPKTKEQLAKAVAEAGQSSFVQSSPAVSPAGGADESPSCEMPFAPFLRKASGAEGGGTPFVMCRGSSFPRTAQSDKNVEVLTAWRTITSNPQFKDVDINELCTEFTNKARCDGTKVVLEPEGVHHIIETLAARQAANQTKA